MESQQQQQQEHPAPSAVAASLATNKEEEMVDDDKNNDGCVTKNSTQSSQGEEPQIEQSSDGNVSSDVLKVPKEEPVPVVLQQTTTFTATTTTTAATTAALAAAESTNLSTLQESEKETKQASTSSRVQTRGKKIQINSRLFQEEDETVPFLARRSSFSGTASTTANTGGPSSRRIKRRSSAASSVTSATSSLVAACEIPTQVATASKGGRSSSTKHGKNSSSNNNNNNNNKSRAKRAGKFKRQAQGGTLANLQPSGVTPLQVRDIDDTRIVNPLIEWSPKATVAGGSGGSAGSKDAQKKQLHSSELMPLLHLWQPLPDTYPISYQARLLGFDIKVPNMTHHTATGDLPPTPLPKQLSFLRDETSYQHIPPLGRFAQQVWNNASASGASSSALPEQDAIVLEEQYDPLYKALVVLPSLRPFKPPQQARKPSPVAARAPAPTAASVLAVATTEKASAGTTASVSEPKVAPDATALTGTVPATTPVERPPAPKPAPRALAPILPTISLVTPAIQSKLMAAFSKAKPAVQSTFQLAQSLLQKRPLPDGSGEWTQDVLSSDWTVCTWAEYEERFPSTKQNFNGTQHIVGLCILPRPLPPLQPPMSTETDETLPNSPTLEPPTVRPLVIVWYTFGWYHYDSNKAGLILQLHDISIPSQSSVFNSTNTDLEVAQMSFLEQTWVIMAICFAFEHARAANIQYALVERTPRYLEQTLATFFRMVATYQEGAKDVAEFGSKPPAPSEKVPETESTSGSGNGDLPSRNQASKVRMVADLSNCSSRLALLFLQQSYLRGAGKWVVPQTPAAQSTSAGDPHLRQLRAIVRFPNEIDAKAMTRENPVDRLRRAATRKPSSSFSSATQPTHKLTVAVKVKLADSKEGENSEFYRMDASQQMENVPIQVPHVYEEPPLEVLRAFAIQPQPTREEIEDDEIAKMMKKYQKEVSYLEHGVEPRARTLLQCVVDERLEFEQSNMLERVEEEGKVLASFRKMQADRKQKIQEEQEQLEQDMNAVCCICDDGEVTPENQILFCDTCDCPVHQMCYGVERVPAGDYHCIACCFLGRDKEGRQKYLDKAKRKVKPLPIVCEMCPQKQGAFIRTQMKSAENDPNGRWVHAVCAKWQGLDFIKGDKPDLVEDVTELKASFRQQNINCELCLGARGCMNKCREEGCEKWIHITCARSVGNCEVTHGEDCHGDVPDKPWTLLCPAHSDVSKQEKPKNPMTVQELIELAKSLPPEPIPEPEQTEKIPFNKASRQEQAILLKDPEYERLLIHELAVNRSIGMRCEICDQTVENAKDAMRCTQCKELVCKECLLASEETTKSESAKCLRCKTENSDKVRPSCVACFCKHGPLRQCFAEPVNPGKWKRNPQQYEKSLFKKAQWIHYTCGLWTPRVFWSSEQPGKLDLVNVVMGTGMSFVHDRKPCFLCGKKFGLKLGCDHVGCKWKDKDGKEHPTFFHVTCARNAGLEVSQGEDTDNPENTEGKWYVKCYRHGGNDYNIRAKLEDLYEIEKARIEKRGKNAGFTFPDGARAMNAAIAVVRMLGWAWRWAEWWVDYNSTWEPLLEPGQKEKDMSKEELRIVESTRESRCADARKCRLVALGAALRNRMYDQGEDYDRVALDRALRAFLSTRSLVGPLEKDEIDFHADWLGRAYRSKVKMLFLGDDKIPVEEKSSFCWNMKDQSLTKFEVAPDKVPGKREPLNEEVFESTEGDIDDFLQTEVMTDPKPRPPRARSRSRSRSRSRPQNPEADKDLPIRDEFGKFITAPPLRDASGKFLSRSPSADGSRRGPGRPPSSGSPKKRKRDRSRERARSRKRSRERSRKRKAEESAAASIKQAKSVGINDETPSQAADGENPRGSGRPRMSAVVDTSDRPNPDTAAPVVKRKRGRPSKRSYSVDDSVKDDKAGDDDDGFGFEEVSSDNEAGEKALLSTASNIVLKKDKADSDSSSPQSSANKVDSVASEKDDNASPDGVAESGVAQDGDQNTEDGHPLNAMSSIKHRRRTTTDAFPGLLIGDTTRVDRDRKVRRSSDDRDKEENKEEDRKPAAKEKKPKNISTDDWPLTDIPEPTDNDVLLGNLGKNHVGNLRHIEMALERKTEYMEAISGSGGKMRIAHEIVQTWRNSHDPPGRFLDLDEKTQMWHDIGDRRAADKSRKVLNRRGT